MHLMEVPGGLEVSNTGVQADYIDLSVLACQIPVSLNQATDTSYTSCRSESSTYCLVILDRTDWDHV